MKVVIDTHYATREEVAALMRYLNREAWDYTTFTKKTEANYASAK